MMTFSEQAAFLDRIRQTFTHLLELMVDDPIHLRTSFEHMSDRSILRVTVPPSDVGKLIGQQGRNARSLRTLLRAVAKTHRVPIELDITGAEMNPELQG